MELKELQECMKDAQTHLVGTRKAFERFGLKFAALMASDPEVKAAAEGANAMIAQIIGSLSLFEGALDQFAALTDDEP